MASSSATAPKLPMQVAGADVSLPLLRRRVVHNRFASASSSSSSDYDGADEANYLDNLSDDDMPPVAGSSRWKGKGKEVATNVVIVEPSANTNESDDESTGEPLDDVDSKHITPPALTSAAGPSSLITSTATASGSSASTIVGNNNDEAGDEAGGDVHDDDDAPGPSTSALKKGKQKEILFLDRFADPDLGSELDENDARKAFPKDASTYVRSTKQANIWAAPSPALNHAMLQNNAPASNVFDLRGLPSRGIAPVLVRPEGWEKMADRPMQKLPIRFVDSVGRNFLIPWDKAKSWMSVKRLIRHAFKHVDVLEHHVAQGRYDLVAHKVWQHPKAPIVSPSLASYPKPSSPAPDTPNEAGQSLSIPLPPGVKIISGGITKAGPSKIPSPGISMPPVSASVTPGNPPLSVPSSSSSSPSITPAPPPPPTSGPSGSSGNNINSVVNSGTLDAIILPELWEQIIEPGMLISMHMWPLQNANSHHHHPPPPPLPPPHHVPHPHPPPPMPMPMPPPPGMGPPGIPVNAGRGRGGGPPPPPPGIGPPGPPPGIVMGRGMAPPPPQVPIHHIPIVRPTKNKVRPKSRKRRVD